MTVVTPVRYSTDQLLTVIHQICREANPEDPTAVTQREFDRARSRLGVDCPRAPRLTIRFKSSWRDLLLKVNRERPDTFRAARRSEQGSKDLIPFDRATAITAVQNAARALGQDTLRPHEYVEYREQLLKQANGLNRQRLEVRWPVVAMIDALDWDKVLNEAGLTRPNTDPKGLDNPDAIGLYLECRGCAPPLRVAIEFSRAQGVSARNRSMRTEEALEVLRERRAAQGKWTPPRALLEDERPEIPVECLELEQQKLAGYQPARKIRPKGWWMNEDRILEGLRIAITKLEPGESLTQVNLRRVARGDNRIPSPNTVTQFAKRNGTNLPELRERLRASLPRR